VGAFYECVNLDGLVRSRKFRICHFDPFDKPFDFAQGHEQGRMAQGKLREKSNLFNGLSSQDFSLCSK